MVELHEERNLVRVFARDRAEHAERGGDGVAAAFHGELHDVFGIETIRVFREARAGGMFDALVHRQDGHITRAGQPAMVETWPAGCAASADCGRTARRCGPRNPVPAGAAVPSPPFCICVAGGLAESANKFLNFSIHSLSLSIISKSWALNRLKDKLQLFWRDERKLNFFVADNIMAGRGRGLFHFVF